MTTKKAAPASETVKAVATTKKTVPKATATSKSLGAKASGSKVESVPAPTNGTSASKKPVVKGAESHSGSTSTTEASSPMPSGPRRTTVRKAPGAPTGPLPPPKPPAAGPYAKEPEFLEEQRKLLVEERIVYQGQAEDLRAEADSLAQEREPGDVQFDEESGEGGTVAVDRERDLALSAQALAAVEEIDDALQRVDRKTYGWCERCQEPIPKARLRALPYARLCVACKSGGLSRR